MSDGQSAMKFNLNEKATLFRELEERPPEWWNTLRKDAHLYIDIRKPAYINVYYHGGSLMKLTHTKGFNASISSEYIPLNEEGKAVRYIFDKDEIRFDRVGIAPIGRFSHDWLRKVKKRMGLFHPVHSENAIKAQYRQKNAGFIDTEFHLSSNARVDLVWFDCPKRKLYFVELKTINDGRLFLDKTVHPGGETRPNVEKIEEQLKKYHDLLRADAPKIREHYQRLYRIKKRLGLLPQALQTVEDTPDLTIEMKPIFLVGDCTEKWIDKYAKEINPRIRHCAYGAIYHGPKTTTFSVPTRDKEHAFLFTN